MKSIKKKWFRKQNVINDIMIPMFIFLFELNNINFFILVEAHLIKITRIT